MSGARQYDAPEHLKIYRYSTDKYPEVLWHYMPCLVCLFQNEANEEGFRPHPQRVCLRGCRWMPWSSCQSQTSWQPENKQQYKLRATLLTSNQCFHTEYLKKNCSRFSIIHLCLLWEPVLQCTSTQNSTYLRCVYYSIVPFYFYSTTLWRKYCVFYIKYIRYL